jgi:nicotinamidase-related amidase
MAILLHVTDMQEDFVRRALAVPGGEAVAANINQFMDDLPADVIDQTVFTYDTHPWFSYFSSPESLPFPAIHCEQGRIGWELAIDALKMESKSKEIFFAPKETFDFWADKATTNIVIKENAAPNSDMGHAFFQKKMQDDGFAFLSRDADRDAFAAAVGHDFDESGNYNGEITVLPYDSSKSKGLEGYYIRKSEKGSEIVALVDQKLVDVYNNIGTLTSDHECFEPVLERDESAYDMKGTKVVMAGLATNFCVFDAMLGYLERGAKVFAIEDLMSGIPNGPDGRQALLDLTGVDRTETGDIRDVLETEHFKKYVESGQLILTGSDDFLVFANAMVNKQPIIGRVPKP